MNPVVCDGEVLELADSNAHQCAPLCVCVVYFTAPNRLASKQTVDHTHTTPTSARRLFRELLRAMPCRGSAVRHNSR